MILPGETAADSAGMQSYGGKLGGLVETITASARISSPRSCQPASDR
jgi:hypothetical protein